MSTVYREAYARRLIDLVNAAIAELHDVPTIDATTVANAAKRLWPADERISPWINDELRVIADEVLRARYGSHLEDGCERLGRKRQEIGAKWQARTPADLYFRPNDEGSEPRRNHAALSRGRFQQARDAARRAGCRVKGN